MPSKNSAFRLLALGTLLLLSIPTIAFALNWHWEPLTQISLYLYPMYLITESGTVPKVFITCFMLTGILLLYFKLPVKKNLTLIVILAASIGAGQIVKSSIKNLAQEPRPYITWLEQNKFIKAADFYQLSRQARSDFIAQQNFSSPAIPIWQQNHWARETGYSFPSGHAIFVSQWALMFLLLLWRKKAHLTLTLVMLWALAIEASRLLLGMHWPIDIFISCLFAPFLTYLTSLYWNKWVFDDVPPANSLG